MSKAEVICWWTGCTERKVKKWGKWERQSYNSLGPWKNRSQLAEIRALWEEWDGGEAQLNGVEGNISTTISSWKPETGIQKDSLGWSYQSDICIHEDELTKGMSDPWAVWRTRGAKDKQTNKSHMGGRGRRWWSPGARECRTLLVCLRVSQ